MVSFRIGADKLDPDKITKVLGIKPSFSHKKGDLIGSSTNARYPSGMWALESPLPSNADVDVQLTDILNMIWLKLSRIKKLRKQGYEMDIAISIVYSPGQHGFTLPAKLVEKLGKLGVDMQFSIPALH